MVEVDSVSVKKEEFGYWRKANSLYHCLISFSSEVETWSQFGKMLNFEYVEFESGDSRYRVMGCGKQNSKMPQDF